MLCSGSSNAAFSMLCCIAGGCSRILQAHHAPGILCCNSPPTAYVVYVVSTYSFMQHMCYLFGGLYITTCCALFLIAYKKYFFYPVVWGDQNSANVCPCACRKRPSLCSSDINCPIPPAYCMLTLSVCLHCPNCPYEFGQLGTGLSWFR